MLLRETQSVGEFGGLVSVGEVVREHDVSGRELR